MRAALLLVALVCICRTAGADETPTLPDGWRFPTAAELSDEKLRDKSEMKYAKAVADFNGDGIPDQAFLLKSTKFSGEGLLVRLSDGPGKFKWMVLHTID